MTSAYRRDHEPFPLWDEYARLGVAAQADIDAAVDNFESLYATPTASEGETRALKRAFARYLIDSGKASEAGVL